MVTPTIYYEGLGLLGLDLVIGPPWHCPSDRPVAFTVRFVDLMAKKTSIVRTMVALIVEFTILMTKHFALMTVARLVCLCNVFVDIKRICEHIVTCTYTCTYTYMPPRPPH